MRLFLHNVLDLFLEIQGVLEKSERLNEHKFELGIFQLAAEHVLGKTRVRALDCFTGC